MIEPYELVYKLALPAIRSMIARKLTSEYNLTQEQVSKCLGVTQAAVSYYVRGRRGTLLNLQEMAEVRGEVDELASRLAVGNLDEVELASRITVLGDFVRRSRLLCTSHKKLEPYFDTDSCHACEEGLVSIRA